MINFDITDIERLGVFMQEKLEEYLARADVPLEMRISALIQFSNLPDAKFVRLGEDVLERASDEEKARCAKKIDLLNRLVGFRRSRSQSDN